ncbi:MAG TPA: hypothetical protein VJ276_08525 [Thermoanaerobaculia bacterium]|nr:hypothetical protein [Thermoanaerobaculia bacterium]
MTQLRVVGVSPSDVRAERQLIREVVEELNRDIAPTFGCQLIYQEWETDVAPQFHRRGIPGVIDDSLRFDTCDILIGIFWKRFGTPTADAASGTEHELRLAHAAWQQTGRPRIMLYSKVEPFYPDGKEGVDQFKQLVDFKLSLEREALWGRVESADAFKGQLHRDILQVMGELVHPETTTSLPAKAAGNENWMHTELGHVPLYTFSGLRTELQSSDVFQDFRVDGRRHGNPNPVSHLWADVYRGCSINASVELSDPPHLIIKFDNKGSSWPSNITLRPIGERAVKVGRKTTLAFEARISPDDNSPDSLTIVGVAVRIVNGWYQHWAYGHRGEYTLLDDVTAEWRLLTVPLVPDPDEWWLFGSDGNYDFGPRKVDLRVIAGVVLEFGSISTHRPGQGEATVEVRSVHFIA